MYVLRISDPCDIPALRQLWTLAFGDGGDYLDNFFNVYYRPERMLVLEEEGQILAMTAWFDTSFEVPGQGSFPAAYLYAVATHPDFRSRGLSGRLLAWADEYFRSLGIPAVTTVPARPSLHNFFAANGFRECFCHDELRARALSPSGAAPFCLESLTPETYGALRETMLNGIPHISFPPDALTYQSGCCRISGGGLYTAQTGWGPVLLCAEGMEDGTLLLKELLGEPQAREELLTYLPALLPAFSGIYRIPGTSIPFGMLKWLANDAQRRWDWSSTAYLGLAFD